MERTMAGKLYLCATPIGNLEDITCRVLRTLKEVDLIAAEDTRNSIKLLNHFEIKTPMTSYHEYNKIEKAYQLVDKLREGKNIALITDAGTPGISDPGEDLVRICYEEGIEVTSLPGAAACITALTMSGLPTRRFAFEAFLPREKKERAAILQELKDETRTIIIYEAPHHLVKTLEELYDTLGDRQISICRATSSRAAPRCCANASATNAASNWPSKATGGSTSDVPPSHSSPRPTSSRPLPCSNMTAVTRCDSHQKQSRPTPT